MLRWAADVLAVVAAGWAALSVLIGSDWRLAPCVVISFAGDDPAAAGAIGGINTFRANAVDRIGSWLPWS